MRQDTSCAKCNNWAMKVKTILNEYGFGSAWLNQSVYDQNKFIVLFERKIKDSIKILRASMTLSPIYKATFIVV